MLIVTEAAAAHLAQMLDAQKAPPNMAVRFTVEGQSIAMQPDTVREGDSVFQHEARTVLLLDEEMAKLFADDRLDLTENGLELQPAAESD
jgi:Fe-S cluster assembly iron-binding protein IscA